MTRFCCIKSVTIHCNCYSIAGNPSVRKWCHSKMSSEASIKLL